jgi:hypothetical protein
MLVRRRERRLSSALRDVNRDAPAQTGGSNHVRAVERLRRSKPWAVASCLDNSPRVAGASLIEAVELLFVDMPLLSACSISGARLDQPDSTGDLRTQTCRRIGVVNAGGAVRPANIGSFHGP